MIWDSVSKTRIFCTLVVITICSGCLGPFERWRNDAEKYVDLSDPAASKASIRATGWDFIRGLYCHMTAPANTEHVTVNAGTVQVSVRCEAVAIGSVGPEVDRASFSFDARVDHEYLITKHDCNACFKLKDLTTKEVLAEIQVFGPESLPPPTTLKSGEVVTSVLGSRYACEELYELQYESDDAGEIWSVTCVEAEID